MIFHLVFDGKIEMYMCIHYFRLLNIYDFIFYLLFPFWFAPSFSVGRVSKSHVHPDTAHGVVSGCPLLVVGVVPGLVAIGTVVALSQHVSACKAICVWLTPIWLFFIVFGCHGVVDGLIAVLVAASLR